MVQDLPFAPTPPATAAMADDRALLWLLQLSSPALPVGGYAYSEGLEAAIASGQVATAAAVERWLQSELTGGAIALDVTLLVQLHRHMLAADWDAVVATDRWLAATRETEELRGQNAQMGRSLARLLDSLWTGAAGDRWHRLHERLDHRCTWTTAFAAAAALGGVAERTTALAYCQGWASNLVTAAVKVIPLGQTEGQGLLFTLADPIAATAAAALTRSDLGDVECCSWGLSMASLAHETQYARLFRS